VTANFPFNYVVVASSHDSEDGDVLLFPNNFQGFGKGSHEEKEEDRGHVIALSDSDCLGDFNTFVLNFEDADIVGVEGSNCSDKFRRSTVSFEDAEEKGVVGCVVGFDKIDETDV
jgi:hypothetical protein